MTARSALHALRTLVVASSFCAAACVAAPALKAGVFDPPAAAPAFRLDGSDGQPLTLDRFRGRVVLLVFGFTRCPEVCPTTLATLAQARKALGAEAAAVQVVWVTVDPARDNAAQVRGYLAGFDAGFVGGTGSPAAIEGVERLYGVSAKKIPLAGGDYAMGHTSSIWLIDRDGRLRGMMPYGHDAADFVHDVRVLLAAK